jgi:hypothetical protein
LSFRLLPKTVKIRIYKTIILPVVLYGCETRSQTLREEQELTVFENRLLRRIFEPRRDEVDRLCGLVVRVLGYRSGGPGSIPGTTRKKM